MYFNFSVRYHFMSKVAIVEKHGIWSCLPNLINLRQHIYLLITSVTVALISESNYISYHGWSRACLHVYLDLGSKHIRCLIKSFATESKQLHNITSQIWV